MLQDILAAKKALFADGVQTVLRGQENRTRSVAFVNGDLVSNVRSETRGINARVLKNGVYGFASMAEYSESAAESVLKAATENAFFLANHAGSDKKAPRSFGLGNVALNHDLTDAEQKKIIEACREMDNYIAKNYPDLKSRTISYRGQSHDKIVYTSDAFSGHVTYPRCHIYTVMSTETKDGVPVELFKAHGGFGNFDEVFGDVSKYFPDIDDLYRKLMDKKEGVYADAGYKTVILGGDLAGMLSHEAVGHTVEADLVAGGSVAGPLLNKQVASPLVTLVDFAHTTLGQTAPLPVYLDDEGTVAQDAVLIKDGILTGYMHNRESAERWGVAPTGNARAWDFSDEPIIRMRNTAILPGKDKFDDMIASVDDGYLLVKTGNGQADLTGEFMFGVNMGYEIKNGKLGRALLDTTVSGIAFDMLKTVDMVSSDMNWSSAGTCGKKQPMTTSFGGPYLRCKIMIGGR
ncbi:MAG: TldD/PmbA family protein [Lachnospiraceae bacterium]|nr:TldD/PmbA family protein [Lachnospiraceae bacterium]